MRTLPKNISAHPDGLLVRVERGELRYQAFVPKNWVGTSSTSSLTKPQSENNGNAVERVPTALDRALELRDNFLRIAPAPLVVKTKRPRTVAYSNTGVVGVSETVTWAHQRRHDCFSVSWRGQSRRIYYGPNKTRETALREAIALRQSKVGTSSTSSQINPEVCNGR